MIWLALDRHQTLSDSELSPKPASFQPLFLRRQWLILTSFQFLSVFPTIPVIIVERSRPGQSVRSGEIVRVPDANRRRRRFSSSSLRLLLGIGAGIRRRICRER